MIENTLALVMDLPGMVMLEGEGAQARGAALSRKRDRTFAGRERH